MLHFGKEIDGANFDHLYNFKRFEIFKKRWKTSICNVSISINANCFIQCIVYLVISMSVLSISDKYLTCRYVNNAWLDPSTDMYDIGRNLQSCFVCSRNAIDLCFWLSSLKEALWIHWHVVWNILSEEHFQTHYIDCPHSSVARASDLQAWGCQFEPHPKETILLNPTTLEPNHHLWLYCDVCVYAIN